jgi:hypothetical protein
MLTLLSISLLVGPANGPTSKGHLTCPDPLIRIRLNPLGFGPMWSSVRPELRSRLVTKPQPSRFRCEFPVGTSPF